MRPRIFYVDKEILYPAFGLAEPSNKKIFIRNDLPESVQDFIKEHELYHLTDTAKFWMWRELKANIAGALKHPIGFIICAFMSLSPYRLKFYWNRLKRNE